MILEDSDENQDRWEYTFDDYFSDYFETLSKDLINHTANTVNPDIYNTEEQQRNRALEYFDEVEMYSFGNDEDPLRFEF